MAMERERASDEDDEDVDFDPLSELNAADGAPGTHPELLDGQGEGGESELGFVEADYDCGFLELGEGPEDDEEEEEEEEDEEEEEEEEEEDDPEVDDKREDTVEDREEEMCEAGTIAEAGMGESSSGDQRTEDELMGNALEALPELHSPAGHEKYELATNVHDDQVVLDAISRRTRAHYSLADMTLDQLETFLQESDEDDYFHNVDDEEEYRKFVAAVTQSAAVEGDGVEAKDAEDEDEEDDADFELEIEEALDSDSEEAQKMRHKRKRTTGRRPETREQRRERLQRPLSFAQTPLRPLVPYQGSSSMRELSFSDRSGAMLELAYREGLPNANARQCGSCFTAHQLGQLYSLIYEHVQLLVQVFSLCVLEPSRQQIAMSTYNLLVELANKCESAVFRQQPYPDFCFQPPYVRSSAFDQPLGELALNSSVSATDSSSPSEKLWCPAVQRPVFSVMSVPPLDLVKKYLEDVALVAQEYKQLHVQTGASCRFERAPLFSLSESQQTRKVTTAGPGAQAKKTMAAMLVESTRKQTIAVVPKNVAAAVSRFTSFFNPALFPRKPPPPATANRLLFVDSEDELLASGLATFNNDWKAIQERFLPTKSTHQIFVRQKNRSSARAPENSIKAIRRMKNSPLTSEEKDSIQEALRYFKFDWNKVWQFAVPHRDPALLPRQWRTALGTQKSYKSDEASKEKRRLHEANKRRMKAIQMNPNRGLGEGEVIDETHIHEAFLTDWRSPSSSASEPQNIVHQSQSSSTKRQNMQTVKLAPGLPPLNLPPDVRVISSCNPQRFHPPQRPVKHPEYLHPLLLQPSQGPNPSVPATCGPAFHPFFEAKNKLEATPNSRPTAKDRLCSFDRQKNLTASCVAVELSDSKDEQETSVQFECEEMDDSDKEYSQEEQRGRIDFEQEEIGSESECGESDDCQRNRSTASVVPDSSTCA